MGQDVGLRPQAARAQRSLLPRGERADHEVGSGSATTSIPYEYVCECSHATCSERIALRREEYEHVRAEGTRFVLAPGNVTEQIEKVVERDRDHVLIEKVGVAGDLAAELDPRAA